MKTLLVICTLGLFIDYATTAWSLAHGGDEVNLFVSFLISKAGLIAFLMAKVIAALGIWFAVWLLDKDNKRITELFGEPGKAERRLVFAVAWVITLGQWLIVSNNLWQMRIAIALGY